MVRTRSKAVEHARGWVATKIGLLVMMGDRRTCCRICIPSILQKTRYVRDRALSGGMVVKREVRMISNLDNSAH